MFTEAWLSKRRWGQFVYVILWTVAFVLVLFGVAERYLYILGFRVEDTTHLRKHMEYDDYLGSKPASPDGVIRHIAGVDERIWPDSSRVSRTQREKKASKRVLLLGCSYTFGFALPDNETFPWFLNERFPDIAFDNFAVPGYGTYQCYLREKQRLMIHPDYDLVLYCSFDDHLYRNVKWADHHDSRDNSTSYAFNPMVGLDKQGQLLFYDQIRRWPWDDTLISVNFAKRVYYRWLMMQNDDLHGKFSESQCSIFWILNYKMAGEAKRHGAQYGMVWLMNKGRFQEATEARDRLADYYPWGDGKCPWENGSNFPMLCNDINPGGKPEYAIPGDVHFNVKVQRIWAQQIGDWLEEWWLKGK